MCLPQDGKEWVVVPASSWEGASSVPALRWECIGILTDTQISYSTDPFDQKKFV